MLSPYFIFFVLSCKYAIINNYVGKILSIIKIPQLFKLKRLNHNSYDPLNLVLIIIFTTQEEIWTVVSIFTTYEWICSREYADCLIISKGYNGWKNFESPSTRPWLKYLFDAKNLIIIKKCSESNTTDVLHFSIMIMWW